MGQHKTKAAIKGDGYKSIQRIQPRALLIKSAPITDKWLERHGYVKVEKKKVLREVH